MSIKYVKKAYYIFQNQNIKNATDKKRAHRGFFYFPALFPKKRYGKRQKIRPAKALTPLPSPSQKRAREYKKAL